MVAPGIMNAPDSLPHGDAIRHQVSEAGLETVAKLYPKGNGATWRGESVDHKPLLRHYHAWVFTGGETLSGRAIGKKLTELLGRDRNCPPRVGYTVQSASRVGNTWLSYLHVFEVHPRQ